MLEIFVVDEYPVAPALVCGDFSEIQHLKGWSVTAMNRNDKAEVELNQG